MDKRADVMFWMLVCTFFLFLILVVTYSVSKERKLSQECEAKNGAWVEKARICIQKDVIIELEEKG